MLDFKKEILTHSGLSLGFGLFWTWVWLIFQTTLVSPAFLTENEFSLPGWIVPLAAYAGMFLFLGGLLKFKNIVLKDAWYLRAIPASMSLGILIGGVLSFSPLADPLINGVVVCFGGLLMGAGTACLHVEWGRMMGFLGPRKTILHGIIGTILAAVFLGVVDFFGGVFVWVCAFLIPVLSMKLLMNEMRKQQGLYAYGVGAKLNIPRRFLATSFTQGLSFGIVRTILFASSYDGPVVAITGFSLAISAVIVLVCALFFRMDFNQLIYQVGFLIMALGYLMMALIAPDFMGALLVQMTGYKFVDIMMWALCVYLIKQRGLPTNWVFAITTCFLLLGQLVGSVVATVVASLFSLEGSGAINLSIIMVFVLLSLALLLSDRKNLQTGWGMVRPGDIETAVDNFEMGCTLVCRQNNLTAREEEIFILLAKGLTRASICGELTLSKETVKTHIRNIYRKMDIHSQQEVFVAVEAEQRSFGFEEETPHEMRI